MCASWRTLWSGPSSSTGRGRFFFADILSAPSPARWTGFECLPDRDTGSLHLDAVAARHIRRVLDLCHGRVEGDRGAARLLGIHPSTLRKRMRKLGIAFGRKAPPMPPEAGGVSGGGPFLSSPAARPADGTVSA